MIDPSSSTSSATDAPPTPSSSTGKTVFLIRHAHSMENQRIASMFNCFGDLGRFSMPKKSDVNASLELLNLEHDAPLSKDGLQQCETMKNLLKENDFLLSNKIELVVHSPLQRAKQTCEELVGCSSSKKDPADPKSPKSLTTNNDSGELIEFSTNEDTADPKSTTNTADLQSTTNNKEEQQPADSYPAPVQRVVSLSLLEEKHQYEWIPGNTSGFEKRVMDFQQWLADQPESVICVVGHSQYFKKMLELPFKFDNTDVYRVFYDPQKKTPNEPFIMEFNGTADMVTLKPEWYDLKLLHSCNQPPKTDTKGAANDKSLL